MALHLLVFDCDGVILEAMDVKSEAFTRLGEAFGQEAMDRMRDFHSMNGGVNRLEKFRWMYDTFVGREPTERELQELSRRFVELALDRVRSSPLVPGIMDVLDRWKGRVPLAVCSGAPEQELREILELRGLAPYFDTISGAPPAKAIRLNQIVIDARIDPADAVMVGDAFADMEAATFAGTRFYGRGSRFAGSPWPWHDDMTRLNDWLESLAAER